MAIYLCQVNQIGRRSGRNAVAAAAYRSATKLSNERDGLTYNYTNKKGVELAEIILANDVDAQWALDRERLWNAAEKSEKRKDARVATEVLVALPHELTPEDYTSLTRQFAQALANRYRVAIDVAIHRPSGETDGRNIHAHLLMPTRTVSAQGLEEKTRLNQRNAWLLESGLPTTRQQLLEIRETWAHYANRYLARSGLDNRIDHRSYVSRGIEIEPTQHLGVSATQMARRGLPVSRRRIEEKASLCNAELIRKRPEQVLRLITHERSVFDRYDIARALHRYIDDAPSFDDALTAAMASPTLVMLCPEQNGEPARYSTREMVGVEHTMIAGAARMAVVASYPVDEKHVEGVLQIQNDLLKAKTSGLGEEVEGNNLTQGAGLDHVPMVEEQVNKRAELSDEQRAAINHITGPEQIAAVVGFAGAGKSTMLAAARDAWQRQGYRVHGAALAGIAAEGLQATSGIISRTLASWEYGWQDGKRLLGKGDILVVDEAGMIASHQLARLITKSEARGAKLVLVGDYEQLQAIGAGSPFRAVVEQIGAVELAESRRQKQDWQREATIAFATRRTGEGLAAYADRGGVKFSETTEDVRADLVRDYMADIEAHPSVSRIALAHRRADVHALNLAIRVSLQKQGWVAGTAQEKTEPLDHVGREFLYQTIQGGRRFASGDRIIFLKNNHDLRVKNGMLGTVQTVEQDTIHVRLDAAAQSRARLVSVPVANYRSFDHGYATTIHKAQGATVDRAFVMGSQTMDRHLTYVAMSRHRFDVQLHVGRDQFGDMKALAASMSRSGVKETTLDYITTFAERRDLVEKPDGHNLLRSRRLGARDKAASAIGPMQAALSKAARVADHLALSAAEASRGGQGGAGAVETPEPLLPALNNYDRSVEDVARSRAVQSLQRELEAVRMVGRRVYADPEAFVSGVAAALMDMRVGGAVIANSIALRPEQFGTLRGNGGLLGENKERRVARRDAVALSKLVELAGKTWSRRLEEERRYETWEREKRDVVVIPGLSRRSEAILKRFSRLPQSDKVAFLERLKGTVDGKQALKEAEAITRAIEKRFGSSDLKIMKKEELRLGSITAAKVTRVADVAQLAEGLSRADLNREYAAKQSLDKKLGLGLSI